MQDLSSLKAEALITAKRLGIDSANIVFSRKLEWIAVNGKPALRQAAIDRTSQKITLFIDAMQARWPDNYQRRSLGVLTKCIATLKRGTVKTLYIHRVLKNADEVIAWAKANGFATTLIPEEMHVTVAYSKKPVDWDKVGRRNDTVNVPPNSNRSVEQLGDEGAVVLRFASAALSQRWQELVEAGASWDYPSYKPHVTLTYDGDDVDLKTIKPYSGKLIFGPEIFAKITPVGEIEERDWDEDEHPRDEDGKFTFGGGGSDDGSSGEGYAGGLVVPEDTGGGTSDSALDSEVIGVGGDSWNKATAVRLEKEYQRERSGLERIATAAVGKHAESPDGDDEEEEAPYVPDEWQGMSNDQQEEAKQHYLTNNKNEVYDNEVTNWQENGEALHIAKKQLADEFDNGEEDWAIAAISDFRVEHDGRIPFTDDQILAALSVTYTDEDYDGKADPEIEFDDSKLDKPDYNFNPAFTADQLPLPGVDAPPAKEPHEALTDEMRTGILDALVSAFNEKADNDQGNVEPPDYLNESADEYLEQSWDGKDDNEKFSYVTDSTQIIEEATNEQEQHPNALENSSGPVELPIIYDPLQSDKDSQDYRRTQRLANRMSIDRQMEVLAARGLGADVDRDQVKRIDSALWSGWKGSSTNFQGSLLQLAAAEELGGRYRDLASFHRTDLIKQADDKYSHIGGFNGIKAMVRAKWETTQYLLEKADIQTIEVYRGLRVDLSTADKENVERIEADKIDLGQQTSSATIYEKLSDVAVVRNGAMSTTTSRSVANGWNAGSGNTKLVLRIDTPRTSVLSVPAYGINVHTEREVVVVGTAWGSWDAWKDNAPSFTSVPMKAAA